MYFVDDHFLLQPKRIEAICNGIHRGQAHDSMGARRAGRFGCATSLSRDGASPLPDSDVRHRERKPEDAGSLQKEQTLAEIETAVTNAKKAGIEIVHGFFVVGIPDETVEDMRATFDFASKIPLDTFGFNRLCVYRGTPLWQEYVKRGLVNDANDWYKYFKCSEIDPTCLPGEVIHAVRREDMRRLIIYKFTRFPIQTFRLLRRFLRYMPYRDVVYLIVKPFLGQRKGSDEGRGAVSRGRAWRHQGCGRYADAID